MVFILLLVCLFSVWFERSWCVICGSFVVCLGFVCCCCNEGVFVGGCVVFVWRCSLDVLCYCLYVGSADFLGIVELVLFVCFGFVC